MKSQNKKILIKIIGLLIILVSFFQNCTNSIQVTDRSISSGINGITNTPTPTDPESGSENPGTILKDLGTVTTAKTKLNESVKFSLSSNEQTNLIFKDLTISNPNAFGFSSGRLDIVDLSERIVRYTPDIGFRGADSGNVLVRDKYGNKINYKININVENAIKTYEPAVAIRAIGCIQCHAKIESNMITDFGAGNDYYFSLNRGNEWWKDKGIYGDHGRSIRTMELASTISALVPKAVLPSIVKNETHLNSIADYLRYEFSRSPLNSTREVQVVEKDHIYIGAPTVHSILSSFDLIGSQKFKYYKDSASSVDFSGLSQEEGYFKNSSILYCEGDLALNGSLFLENLKIKSKTGCRIYVTGTVFIYGSIEYIDKTDGTNLQITSAKAIAMGLGFTKNDEGRFCDPDSRYANEQASYNVSSMVNRFKTFYTVDSYSTREFADAKAFGQSVIDESITIEREQGQMMDADCRPEGKNISFERLLLNAPQIQSRYEGNFQGVIIAEIAIMRLGDFKFKYDPVFKTTPILPFVNQAEVLMVTNDLNSN